MSGCLSGPHIGPWFLRQSNHRWWQLNQDSYKEGATSTVLFGRSTAKHQEPCQPKIPGHQLLYSSSSARRAWSTNPGHFALDNVRASRQGPGTEPSWVSVHAHRGRAEEKELKASISFLTGYCCREQGHLLGFHVKATCLKKTHLTSSRLADAICRLCGQKRMHDSRGKVQSMRDCFLFICNGK